MKRTCFLLLALASLLPAATTTAWEMNTYQDFSKGRFHGLSLTRDGRMMLAPSSETLFSHEEPYVWSVAQGSNGTMYLGTGHRGHVYSIDAAGKGTILFKAPQPEVFAVAAAPDGSVYAATSPDGRVFRIQNGKAVEYFNPQSKYIWALAVAPEPAPAQSGVPTPTAEPAVSAPGTTTRVTDEAAQNPAELKPKPDPTKAQPAPQPVAPIAAPPIVEMMGVEKSALYKINPDNTVET